jgi:hypothetical protein
MLWKVLFRIEFTNKFLEGENQPKPNGTDSNLMLRIA